MTSVHTYVASQQLEAVNGMLYQDPQGEFTRAFTFLARNLWDIPRSKRDVQPREYCELREAKTLVSYLKYPDSTAPVRHDEMAWALAQIARFFFASGCDAWAQLIVRVGQMLDIDLTKHHDIPADMDRRIANELLLSTPATLADAI